LIGALYVLSTFERLIADQFCELAAQTITLGCGRLIYQHLRDRFLLDLSLDEHAADDW
jgi:hypothetical protein